MDGLQRTRTGRRSGERLGKALGWASLGLGLSQVTVPGRFARAIGVDATPGTRQVARAVGARELATAAGIVRRPRPGGWLWARVGGDATDLALLGNALRSARSDRRRVAAATAAVLGIAALDVLAAVRLGRRVKPSHERLPDGALHVEAGVTVNRGVEEAYAFWHDLSRLPSFMAHLASVRTDELGRSHWVANAPAGTTVEWDAEIVEDVVGELIAWRSVEVAEVTNSGAVRFRSAPGGRGTEVRVELTYGPPAGGLGVAVAKLLGEEPQQQVEDDLRRFKQIIETGEVVRSEGTPEGRHARRQLRQRPAQPVG